MQPITHKTGLQLFINYCRLIRTCNLIDDYGMVWISKRMADGSIIKDGFHLGIGTMPGKQLRYWLPLDRWDDCYFAKELINAPAGDELTPDQAIDVLQNQQNQV